MVSFDQFIGLLRSFLLETKSVEVALNPYMLTACLFMSHQEWQGFGWAAFQRLHFHVEQEALSNSSTILDLYFASIFRAQSDSSRAAQSLVFQPGQEIRLSKSARLH